ncbi:hypothetical protein N658DRAFT_511854 [Parathielavia hyrcaniae]|uniref:Zn(2)-C6 fungal-type domain-containing protein n=1 Tax=Parathielavia hyrcaniae TaxID=113614 RepID=A0AAN6PQ66_9PEZI|nr:hypothetical protein N658DRAFT_511854 [Parathielavia hyrcaniae]
MADRVKKRTSSDRRCDQVRFLERSGIIMPSCTYCHEKKLECVAHERYARCLPCAKAGRSNCDVHGVDLRPFIKEKERLDAAKKALLEELFQKQSKLMRLEQQSRALEERAIAAFRRESRLLDEEEKEERSAAARSTEAPPTSTSAPSEPPSADPYAGYDWLSDPTVDLGCVGVGPSFLADQGSSGGTPPVSQGSGGS